MVVRVMLDLETMGADAAIAQARWASKLFDVLAGKTVASPQAVACVEGP